MVDLLGGILGGISSIGSLVQGGINSQREWDISQKNLAMQQQNLDYQKAMQREAWQREDSSVSRRVQDLKKAGLSPVLAAGSGASSSSPISVTTPQQHTPKLDLGLQGMNAGMQMAMAAITQQADIARTQAQKDLIEAQTAYKQEENYSMLPRLKGGALLMQGNKLAQEIDLQKESADYFKEQGLPPIGATPANRETAEFATQLSREFGGHFTGAQMEIVSKLMNVLDWWLGRKGGGQPK